MKKSHINNKHLLNYVTKLRRELHQIPEIALNEYKTSEYIKKTLEEIGYKTQGVATTGVIAYKPGTDSKLKPICFRAEMDALEGEDLTNQEYSSKGEISHLCGHDGHMAALLGFAKEIFSLPSGKRGVILLFQPGEENAGGGEIVMKDNNFNKFDIGAIFATHLQPDLPQGSFGSKSGEFMSQVIDFNIVIESVEGCHAAYPHKGIDTIVVAAKLVEAYQSIISRSVNPTEAIVLSIGKILGGENRNSIARTVNLEGTLRTLNINAYNVVVARMEEINKGFELSYNVKIRCDFINFCPLVCNDEMLYKQTKELIDNEKFIEMFPLTISEDFGFYQTKMPGLMIMTGTNNKNKGFVSSLHSNTFNFDESVLVDIINLFLCIAKYWECV